MKSTFLEMEREMGVYARGVKKVGGVRTAAYLVDVE